MGRVHVIVQRGYLYWTCWGKFTLVLVHCVERKSILPNGKQQSMYIASCVDIPISKNYTFILSYLLLRGECVEEELVLESSEETDSSTRGAVGRSHSS